MSIQIFDCDEKYVSIINKTFDAYCEYFSLKEDDLEVELNFVSDEEIKAINLESRGKDKVTDVLSFPTIKKIKFPIEKAKYPYAVNPETGCLMLGNIVVCIDKIISQAEEFAHSLERELSYLFCHGLLHLIGYDHIKKADKEIMRLKEEDILSGIKQ